MKIDRPHAEGVPHLREFCENVLTGLIRRKSPVAHLPGLLRYGFAGLSLELCEIIWVPFEEQMLTEYPHVAVQVVLKNEPWKASVSEAIRTQSSKFYDKFNVEESHYILARLSAEMLESILYRGNL